MALNKKQLPPPPEGKVLWSVDEACSALSIGRTKFYQLVHQGLIHPVRIGSSGVRVPASEVKALPERLRGGAAA